MLAGFLVCRMSNANVLGSVSGQARYLSSESEVGDSFVAEGSAITKILLPSEQIYHTRRWKMGEALSWGKVLGLILAGIIGGAALAMLALGGIASLSGDDSGAACAGIGGVLLLFAGYIAIRVLVAA